MAKAPATKTPTPAKTPPAVTAATRRLRLPRTKHLSRKLRKQAKAATPKLPSAFKLLWAALKIVGKNWKLFAGMLLIYAVLRLVFSLDTSSFGSISATKSTFSQLASGHLSAIIGGTATFAYLLGGSSGSGSSDPAAGLYEIFFGITFSLAFIWALRQVYAGHRFRVRDAFYRGMYPLVPFSLTLLLIGVQLVPMIIGISLYLVVVQNGIYASGFEQAMWALLAFLLSVWSVYLICPTIISLYAVCLPDATPLAAVRAVRQVVRLRRWTVLRKLLFLPLALVVLGALVALPFILWLTPAAPWIVFMLTLVGLLLIHSYLYGLYRALL